VDTLLWAQGDLQVPVIDHWWQTETGWPAGANCVGIEKLPVKPGSCTRAVPGYDIRILDDHRHEVENGQIGNIVIRLPLPPGSLPTLWNNEEGFEKSYLSEYHRTRGHHLLRRAMWQTSADAYPLRWR
jgi:propionyl-CoA synthetase